MGLLDQIGVDPRPGCDISFGYHPIYLGFNQYGYGGEYLNGYLDEVAIWHRALTSSEVSQIYNVKSRIALDCTVFSPTFTPTLFQLISHLFLPIYFQIWL